MLFNLEIGHCPFRFAPDLPNLGVEIVRSHPFRTTKHHVQMPTHLVIIRLDIVQEGSGAFDPTAADFMPQPVAFQRHGIWNELFVPPPCFAVNVLAELPDEPAIGMFVIGFVAANPKLDVVWVV